MPSAIETFGALTGAEVGTGSTGMTPTEPRSSEAPVPSQCTRLPGIAAVLLEGAPSAECSLIGVGRHCQRTQVRSG
ncbi:hypothetical protein GCM10009630_63780 [Kribbella jejuensis]